MRYVALCFLVLLQINTTRSQCCCMDIELLIPVDHLPGVLSERAFEVKETRGQYTFHRVDRDSTDGVLRLFLDAGCGLRDTHLEITRTTTGERMELRVLFMGFDGAHPGLRVPFVGGSYEVDLERLISCTGADVRLHRRPRTPERTEFLCGTCRVVMEHDSLGVLLEPLDLCCGACASGGVDDGGPGKASFPYGQEALEQAVVGQLEGSGRSALRRSITLDAVGCVNERGDVYARMEQEQTDPVYKVEMALMHVKGWSPAWVSDPAAPDGRRPLRSMVRFRLDLGTSP